MAKDYMNTIWPNGRLRIMVTGFCNAHCKHCHNEGMAGLTEFVPIEIVEIFANIASSENDYISTVTFSGGEPLLHPNISEFCKLFRLSTRSITIPTNGLLLDSNKIESLAISGVSKIRLDVDPWRLEWNTNHYGINEKEISKRIDMIRNHGLHVALNSVLTDYRLSDLKKLFIFCERKKLSIKLFEKAGRCTKSGFLVRDPDLPFSVIKDVLLELYPEIQYKDDGSTNGDIVFSNLPFSLRYCRLLCAADSCRKSGLKCYPDGRIATCINNLGIERLTVNDSEEIALEKIKKVVKSKCVKKVMPFLGH